MFFGYLFNTFKTITLRLIFKFFEEKNKIIKPSEPLPVQTGRPKI
jgi:hypothetical protein